MCVLSTVSKTEDSGIQGAVSDALHDATYKSATGATSLVCNLAIEQSKQGEMPNITGDVKTTGLAIYYAYYKYVKKRRDEVTKQNTGAFGTKKPKPKKEESPHHTKLEFNNKDQVIPIMVPFSFKELLFGKASKGRNA